MSFLDLLKIEFMKVKRSKIPLFPVSRPAIITQTTIMLNGSR